MNFLIPLFCATTQGGSAGRPERRHMIAWYEEEITQVPIRHPCEKWCPYEWGSKECFIRRGYEYDWHDRKWVRDEQGKPVIGKKQCDWEPKEEKSETD